jgi:hypothetical protein
MCFLKNFGRFVMENLPNRSKKLGKTCTSIFNLFQFISLLFLNLDFSFIWISASTYLSIFLSFYLSICLSDSLFVSLCTADAHPAKRLQEGRTNNPDRWKAHTLLKEFVTSRVVQFDALKRGGETKAKS